MKGGRRYKEGDKLIVVDNPVLDIDRRYAGKEVILTSDGYDGNGDRTIYNAKIADGTEDHVIFYDADLRRSGSAGNAQKIADLKAEIARLEAEEANASSLDAVRDAPIASSVFIAPTLYTKVDENKWRWFYVNGKVVQYHSHSETKTVVKDVQAALETNTDWEFFPADKD